MPRQQSTPETRSVRLLKVGEQVRHILSELLTRREVHDATLTAHSVSVTEVRMSEGEVLTALRQHTAFFQREVAGRLKLKYAAKLKFLGDESFDEAERIERLLSDPKVARDLGSPEA